MNQPPSSLLDHTPLAHCWVPDVAWPAGVQAAFTTREGGVSRAPYGSWNLGDHVGDDPEAVRLNRSLLAQRTGARPVFLQQVHGTQVLPIGPATPDGAVADACWTDQPGVACTVMVADCLPLLLSSADGTSVAAVHAGWRGLVGEGGHGVIEALCEAWPAARAEAQRRQLRVWLGPCIGPQAFEVGEEVRTAFIGSQPGAGCCFTPQASPGKYLADLPKLARQRLAALNITQVTGNDGSPVWCTVQQSSRFFSHRRDAASLGSTGRMAALIWRTV